MPAVDTIVNSPEGDIINEIDNSIDAYNLEPEITDRKVLISNTGYNVMND